MGAALLLALHTSPLRASSIRARCGFCFLMEMLDTMTEVAPLYAVQIVQKMDAVTQGASAAPLHIYCGHDTTIMPILATLGIKLRDWPPYLSHVVGFHWCCCIQARDRVVLQRAILGCCHRNGHGCTDECSSCCHRVIAVEARAVGLHSTCPRCLSENCAASQVWSLCRSLSCGRSLALRMALRATSSNASTTMKSSLSHTTAMVGYQLNPLLLVPVRHFSKERHHCM